MSSILESYFLTAKSRSDAAVTLPSADDASLGSAVTLVTESWVVCGVRL